jgi:predicted RNase H-like nuclease (RuvC/YqgF family)
MGLSSKFFIDDEHVLYSLYQLLAEKEELDDEELQVLFSDLANKHKEIATSKQIEINQLEKDIENLNKQISDKRDKIEVLEKEVEKWSHIS